MRRSRRLASALLAGALCALACDASDKAAPATAPSADETLEALVPSLVDAIQAKQPVFVLDHLATTFKEDGGLDYYDVRALVEKYAFEPQPIGARLDAIAVTPIGDERRRVSAKVAFAFGQRLAIGAPLPEGGVVYALEVDFAKSGPRWQAVSGSYKRVSPPATSPATPPTSTR